MAGALDRTWYNTLIDDDGSGVVGTIWNKGEVDALMDAVDAALASVVDVLPAPVFSSVCRFADADTIYGDVGLTFDPTGAAGLNIAGVAGRGVTVTQGVGSEATLSAIQARAYSPAIEVLDKDNSVNYHFGLDDNDGKALVIGAGYGPGQGLTPGLRYLHGGAWYAPYGQFKFPSTANLSSDGTTLDDVRAHQTFTPTIGGTGGQSGQAYSVQAGWYCKHADLVHVGGRITLSTLGTITGSVQLQNLPFPIRSTASAAGKVGYVAGLGVNVASLGLIGTGSASAAGLFYIAAGGATGSTALTSAGMTAAFDMIFEFEYPTDS